MSNEHLAEDTAWLARISEELPSVPVTAPLERRILAAFDVVAARRQGGLLGRIRRLMAGFGNAVWPGVPAWRPAAALAAALFIGIAAGTFIPFEDASQDSADETASIALDAPPVFDLGENS